MLTPRNENDRFFRELCPLKPEYPIHQLHSTKRGFSRCAMIRARNLRLFYVHISCRLQSLDHLTNLCWILTLIAAHDCPNWQIRKVLGLLFMLPTVKPQGPAAI